MLKKFTFAALLLVLILAACTPLATPGSGIKAATATPAASPTSKLVGVTPIATGSSTANCTVESSIFPTPNPTEAAQLSLFKPVSDSDRIIGNKEASITFLEYSDFQ